MFSRVLSSSLIWRRSLSLTSAMRGYKDPCYEAFLEKVREYRLKSPTGKPIDAGPEYEAELQEALCKLAEKFGGGEGVDLLQFPKFRLPDIDIDPISIMDLPENQPKEEEKNKEVKDKDDKKVESKDKDDKKDEKDQKK
ncbi:hypothetical protein KR009_009245 [Drosophila setifemur]|nr:hypothetical protein KR009_009245 [Drosophila setifemur]